MNDTHPPAALDQHARRWPLLQRISELLSRAAPPANWPFLRQRKDVCVTPAEPGALLASLENEFTTADLEAARVLITDAQSQLGLSPILAQPGATVLVRRTALEEHPFDLVGSGGSLTARDPPAFHANRD